jgi:hypothetical protein
MSDESILIAAAIIASQGIEAKIAVGEAFKLLEEVEKQAEGKALVDLEKEAKFRKGR